MRWTVVWLPDAEQELADCWLNATNRADVSKASNQLERALQTNPETTGESRDDVSISWNP